MWARRRMDLIATTARLRESGQQQPGQLYINGSDHRVCFDLQGIGPTPMRWASAYGPWGVQLRDVRAGEATASPARPTRTSVGEADHIDSAVVHFPSGFTTTLVDPAIDTYHNVIEAPCEIGAFDLTLTGATSSARERPSRLTPRWATPLTSGATARWPSASPWARRATTPSSSTARMVRRHLQSDLHRGLRAGSPDHHRRRRPQAL